MTVTASCDLTDIHIHDVNLRHRAQQPTMMIRHKTPSRSLQVASAILPIYIYIYTYGRAPGCRSTRINALGRFFCILSPSNPRAARVELSLRIVDCHLLCRSITQPWPCLPPCRPCGAHQSSYSGQPPLLYGFTDCMQRPSLHRP